MQILAAKWIEKFANMQLYKCDNKRKETQATTRLPNAIFEPWDMQKDHHHHLIIECSMQAAIFEPEDMQKRSSTACKKPQLQKGRPSNWSQNSSTNLAAFLLQGSFEN